MESCRLMQPAPRKTATNLVLRNSRRKIELGQFGLSAAGGVKEGRSWSLRTGDSGTQPGPCLPDLSERPVNEHAGSGDCQPSKLTVPNRIEPAGNREPRPWAGAETLALSGVNTLATPHCGDRVLNPTGAAILTLASGSGWPCRPRILNFRPILAHQDPFFASAGE
jgi:hypothetical protein